MKTFQASVTISATSETIWAILIDGGRWPEWNTTVEKVEGHIAAGEKVTVYTKVSAGRAFPVRVSEFVPMRRMVWRGGMPLGLFKGERTFTLIESQASEVDFNLKETFSGLLAPLITRSIPDLQPSFDEFVDALKREAESIQRQS